jgi:hypothetical protein
MNLLILQTGIVDAGVSLRIWLQSSSKDPLAQPKCTCTAKEEGAAEAIFQGSNFVLFPLPLFDAPPCCIIL